METPDGDSFDWESTDITPADGDAYWRAHGVKAPGPSRQTASGIEWFFLDPDPSSVNIPDIAHHLARLNRWGGSLTVPCYSVAQHAVLTALVAWTRSGGDPMMALCGLHHDDEEAYLGDMVGPLKSLGNMAYFRWIARLNQRAILTALDLPLEEPAFVKQIDRDLRIAERSAFMVEAADPQRGTYSDKGWMPSEFRFGTEYVGHSSVDEDFDLGVQGCRRFSYDPACGPIVGQWAEIIARPCSVPSPSLPHLGLEFVIGPWSAEMAAFVFEALHRELCLLSQRTERAHNPARRLER